MMSLVHFNTSRLSSGFLFKRHQRRNPEDFEYISGIASELGYTDNPRNCFDESQESELQLISLGQFGFNIYNRNLYE